MAERLGVSRLARRWLAIVWASPGTLLGLAFLLLARATGGAARRHLGALEAHGGVVTGLLERLGGRIDALALGHVILGRDPQSLRRFRRHERIHVRQWERWGPFFLPAYALSSLWALLLGRDPYRGNVFEREAWRE